MTPANTLAMLQFLLVTGTSRWIQLSSRLEYAHCGAENDPGFAAV